MDGWWGGLRSARAGVSQAERDVKSVSGKGNAVCKGPGAAGIMVCPRSCKKRRWVGALRPSGGGDIRLYCKGSRKLSQGVSCERDL